MSQDGGGLAQDVAMVGGVLPMGGTRDLAEVLLEDDVASGGAGPQPGTASSEGRLRNPSEKRRAVGTTNVPFLDSAITETLGTLPGNVFVKIKEVVKKFDHALRTTHKLAANSKKLKADVQNIAAGNVPPDVRKWKPAFESKELDRSVQDGNGGNDVQFLLDIDKSLTYRAAKERLHNACVAWNKQLDAQMVDLRIAALAPETRFNKFIDEATSFNTGHLQTLRSLGIDLPTEWFSERRSDEITQAKAGQLYKRVVDRFGADVMAAQARALSAVEKRKKILDRMGKMNPTEKWQKIQ